jgi:glycosyltransferase involved in cell wall biosynthesis
MDVAIIPSESESESFGVSAVEAQACSTPVIISNIPGLMEATKPDSSSLVVPRHDSVAIAEALHNLYSAPELRKQMGMAGRKYVQDNYEVDRCFETIETLLAEIHQDGRT